MPYLAKADLKTHLYGENVEEITREDDTIVEEAIAAGIAEAKSYLSKYDLDKLFDPDATGYVADVNLKNKVKDLVVWHLVSLANPNIQYDVARDRYEDAIKWFTNVMKGQADPAGWPYPADDDDTAVNENGTVTYVSNTKRNNQF